MALIKCPECGKEISDTCESCVHCGYKLKKGNVNKPQVRRRKGWLVPIIIGGVIFTIVIGIPIIYIIWYLISQH